jgi:hypothetical protein
MSSKADRNTLRSTLELAPLVANFLRDESMCHLKRKRDELLRQLGASRAVQVTGRNGTPVYAQGQLDDDGQFQSGNSFRWSVDMEDSISSCLLSNLKNVELRIGGKLVANFQGFSTRYCIHEFRLGEKADVFNISFVPDNIWIQLEIGWERHELLALGYEEGIPVDLDYFSTFLPKQDEGRICKFLSISTTVEKVRGIIPRALDPVQLEKNDFMIRVRDTLKDHGYTEKANIYARIIAPELYESELDIYDDEAVEDHVLDYVE